MSFPQADHQFALIMDFSWGQKRPRLNVTMGNTTFNWLFDTSTAITCMNANSFLQALEDKKPRLIQKGNRCVAANSSKMNSLGPLEGEILCIQ
jgi:hypothetical protein